MIGDVLTGWTQAIRHAWRHPGFTASLVTILGSGVALATVVFAVVDALVLDPYPFRDPDRLLVVGNAMPEVAVPEGYFERFSGPEIAELTAASTTLEAPLAFDLNSVRAQLDEAPIRLFAAYFWTDPFTTLGLEPTLGRSFLPQELPGTPRAEGEEARSPVALVSWDLWRNQLGSAPEILGRTLSVDGLPHTIVGVVPPGANLFGTDLWLTMDEPLEGLPRGGRRFNLLARHAPGVEDETLASELGLLARRLEETHGSEYPEYQGWRLSTTPWSHFTSFDYRHEALLSLGAVLFVLLLVSANLANLLLGRAIDRQGEVAIHRALGASEGRLLGRALAEIGIYGLLGTAVAMLLARWGLTLVVAWLPAGFGGTLPPSFDARAFGFCLLAGGLATMVCGVAPAWHRARARLSLLGRAENRGTHGRGARRLHRAFVVLQVALALVLSTGALLLARDYLGLARTELGFETEGLISMRLTLPRGDYEPAAIAPFFDRLRTEVETLPGVRRASLATQVPPSTRFGGRLVFDREVEDGATGPTVLHTAVGDEFFATLGKPLRRGRALGAEDHANAPVALVINRLLAEHFFPGQDPLGRRLRVVGGNWDTGWGQIVGIVETVRNQGPGQPPSPEVFSHHRQVEGRWNQLFLTVRGDGDPYALVPAIRRLVLGLDPEQPVYAVATADDILASLAAPRRLAATVLAAFASAALALAALGIYAVVAFSVARRGREMALRMALGASHRHIVRMVLGESLIQAGLGLLLGSLASWLLAGLLARALGPSLALDPGLLALAALLLALAATVSALGPAHRAGRTEPVEALGES